MPSPSLPQEIPEIVQLLLRFNEQASKLHAYSFHRKATAPGSGFRIEFGPNGPVGTHKGADEESTAAVLCVLRMLIQEKDSISFEQIVKMHNSLPISVERKRASEETLSELNKYLSTGCSLLFNDWPVSRGELFECFMYGRYAHLNPDKQERNQRLLDGNVAVMFQSDFEDVVLTFIEYALWYRAFNERVLQSFVSREPT